MRLTYCLTVLIFLLGFGKIDEARAAHPPATRLAVLIDYDAPKPCGRRI